MCFNSPQFDPPSSKTFAMSDYVFEPDSEPVHDEFGDEFPKDESVNSETLDMVRQNHLYLRISGIGNDKRTLQGTGRRR